MISVTFNGQAIAAVYLAYTRQWAVVGEVLRWSAVEIHICSNTSVAEHDLGILKYILKYL